MASEADSLYARIVQAFVEHKGEFFPPEFPDALLTTRLERSVPHLPFHVTPGYAARLTLRPGYLFLEDLLLIDRPSMREVIEIMGWFYDSAKSLGLACRGEAFNVRHYHRLAEPTEREWLFAIVTDDAEDEREASTRWEASAHVAELEGPVDGVHLQPHASPFLTSVYVPPALTHVTEALLQAIVALARRNRVLVVGASSKAFAIELAAQVSEALATSRLGELRPHFVLEVPRIDGFEWYARRGRRQPTRRRLLLEGRLYDA